MAVEDIQEASDLFRPLYDQTKCGDGYVSLEVSPLLARDTEGTIKQAQELWNRVNRPNLMVKIPATKEGVPAIRTSIAAGINVNVTLIFSLSRYGEVRMPISKASKNGSPKTCLFIMWLRSPPSSSRASIPRSTPGSPKILPFAVRRQLQTPSSPTNNSKPFLLRHALPLFVARRKLAPTQPGIMVFLDLADHPSDPRTLRALRELVHHCGRMAREVGSPMVADNARVATTTSSIILIDHNPAIHTLAGPISTPFEPTLPDAATIESTIRNTLARLNRAIQIDVNVKRSTWTAMINNLHGLSLPQIDRIVSDAVFDDRALRDDDLPDMIDAKRKLIASDGVLEHVNSPTSLSDIGGLDRPTLRPAPGPMLQNEKKDVVGT